MATSIDKQLYYSTATTLSSTMTSRETQGLKGYNDTGNVKNMDGKGDETKWNKKFKHNQHYKYQLLILMNYFLYGS